MKSLRFLIETGMERASLVLAAQGITDKLQNMAETLAKIEASDVMPMMDSMKENFGAEVAQRFETTVSEKLRDLTEALRTARDSIGTEIVRMEASVNGEPVSDMALDDGSGEDDMGTSDMAMDGGNEADVAPGDADMAPDANAEMGDDMGGDAEMGGDRHAAPKDSEGEADFSDLFRDAGNAAGRERKGHNESRKISGARALSESANPDALVRKRFVAEVKRGRNAQRAATLVAEHFEIDLDDVIDIIVEKRKGK